MISFGISSIIISVVAICIPIFGIMVSGLAGILARLLALTDLHAATKRGQVRF